MNLSLLPFKSLVAATYAKNVNRLLRMERIIFLDLQKVRDKISVLYAGTMNLKTFKIPLPTASGMRLYL